MKTLKQYNVVEKTTGEVLAGPLTTRQDAREEKNWLKRFTGAEVAIQQIVFTATSERIVR